MATTIQIDDMITVGTLAEKLMLPVTRLIGELMKNGVMATVNEKIDFDTAEIIVSDLGLDVTLERVEKQQGPSVHERRKSVDSKTAKSRPPVVAVMGHVDHGKTSLLDKIRDAKVASGEAGGITQHISAYQVQHNNRLITFLDTPGHEAFAAIREHGAHLTDITIIVVAADDGIKPQTVEAIRYARQAGTKIIVAINKIDKEAADENRVKQQLAENDLMIEEWGGDTIALGVSAKTGQGIPELLDMVLLTADVDDLRAEVDEPARGLIIEAHVEQGRGPVAHGLVESGTLQTGDFIVAGGSYAKLRNLESTDGKPIKQATASTPVVMTGFKTLPEFGEEFQVVPSEKEARTTAETNLAQAQAGGSRQNLSGSELIRMINRNNEVQPFNVIVKADVQGSLTSVLNSLKALDTAEVATQIVSTGVGAINENDLHLAQTSQAVIYGFNVTMPSNIRQAASRDKVSVRLYKVIYELIDDVKEEMTGLLQPKVVETDLGRLIVRGVFKTTKSEVICGGEVTKGMLRVPSFARVYRDNEAIGQEVEVTMLKRGPQETKEVNEGEMCGMSLKTSQRLELQEGDRIELFQRETVARQL